MPDSVHFTNAHRAFSNGNVAGNGALTCALICKPTINSLDGLYHWIFVWEAPTAVAAPLGIANGALRAWDGSGEQSTVTVPALDEWYLMASTKAAGTATLRFHLYRYSTLGWTHTDTGGTLNNYPAPTTIAFPWMSGEWFDGNVLIAGVWDSVLSDATIETLITNKPAWVTAAPDEGWRFDTTSAITPFIGTSTQTGTSGGGGTLDTGDAPSVWSDEEAPAAAFNLLTHNVTPMRWR